MKDCDKSENKKRDTLLFQNDRQVYIVLQKRPLLLFLE